MGAAAAASKAARAAAAAKTAEAAKAAAAEKAAAKAAAKKAAAEKAAAEKAAAEKAAAEKAAAEKAAAEQAAAESPAAVEADMAAAAAAEVLERPPSPPVVSLASAQFDTGRREVAESTIGGQTTCIVCFVNPKSHAAVPCGHQCACGDCSAHMRECPVCRDPVREWMQVRVAWRERDACELKIKLGAEYLAEHAQQAYRRRRSPPTWTDPADQP